MTELAVTEIEQAALLAMLERHELTLDQMLIETRAAQQLVLNYLAAAAREREAKRRPAKRRKPRSRTQDNAIAN